MLDFSKIQAILSDFDGVWTDNKVHTDNYGNETVVCNKYDSSGLPLLANYGIPIFIISQETSLCVAERLKKLNLISILSCDDKASAVRTLLADHGLDANSTLFVGNDINDIPAFNEVKYSACPLDSHPSILGMSNYISPKPGGQGVIRDIVDRITLVRSKLA